MSEGVVRLGEVTDFPPDPVIVAGLRSGDEAVFALLLDEWSRGMLRLARSYVSTAASAEEVVQDTWLAVIRAVGTFEGRSLVAHMGLPHSGQHRAQTRRAREPYYPGEQRRRRASRRRPARAGRGRSRRRGAGRRGQGADRAGGEHSPSRQRAVITLRDMEATAPTRSARSCRSPRPTSGCCSTGPGRPSATTWRPTTTGKEGHELRRVRRTRDRLPRRRPRLLLPPLFLDHMAVCAGCAGYYGGFTATITALGELPAPASPRRRDPAC